MALLEIEYLVEAVGEDVARERTVHVRRGDRGEGGYCHDARLAGGILLFGAISNPIILCGLSGSMASAAAFEARLC
jgi:hypothetical protein